MSEPFGIELVVGRIKRQYRLKSLQSKNEVLISR